jgi:hypothetical protein
MENWNYDQAIAFIESLENPLARRVSRLFLDRLSLLVAKQEAAPEGDFDLLFFVKAVASVAGDGELLRSALDGKNLDAGWEAIEEELARPPS